MVSMLKEQPTNNNLLVEATSLQPRCCEHVRLSTCHDMLRQNATTEAATDAATDCDSCNEPLQPRITIFHLVQSKETIANNATILTKTHLLNYKQGKARNLPLQFDIVRCVFIGLHFRLLPVLRTTFMPKRCCFHRYRLFSLLMLLRALAVVTSFLQHIRSIVEISYSLCSCHLLAMPLRTVVRLLTVTALVAFAKLQMGLQHGGVSITVNLCSTHSLLCCSMSVNVLFCLLTIVSFTQ
jgi:hypothetical protein